MLSKILYTLAILSLIFGISIGANAQKSTSLTSIISEKTSIPKLCEGECSLITQIDTTTLYSEKTTETPIINTARIIVQFSSAILIVLTVLSSALSIIIFFVNKKLFKTFLILLAILIGLFSLSVFAYSVLSFISIYS
jgi:hypothetical protein